MKKDQPDAAESPARRAYAAPRVEESAPFEHLLLGCVRASFAQRCGIPGMDPTKLHS